MGKSAVTDVRNWKGYNIIFVSLKALIQNPKFMTQNYF